MGLRQLANKCLPQCGGQQTSGGIGDPISTTNGNFTMNVTDAMLPGIGETDLEIVRTYNSGLSSRYYSLLGPPQDPVGIFGVGWNSPFQFEVELWENLPLVGPGVVVIYPDGHSARYAGVGGVLTPVTPGETNKVTRRQPGCGGRHSRSRHAVFRLRRCPARPNR
ncbi:MAG: hypothetical protein IPK16_30885 [Anaerolineales bacterium]|nr:hypothetical protein [Anaerolineales bacterium]